MASILASLPAALYPPLGDREACIDAIYRLANGLDTNDVALFDSAFRSTATFTINGHASEGLEAIRADCFDKIARLDTTHFTANTRVNINGDRAKLTASALSQHFQTGMGMKAGQPSLMLGTLYWVDLVRSGELWKIEAMQTRSPWAEGDWDVAKIG